MIVTLYINTNTTWVHFNVNTTAFGWRCWGWSWSSFHWSNVNFHSTCTSARSWGATATRSWFAARSWCWFAAGRSWSTARSWFAANWLRSTAALGSFLSSVLCLHAGKEALLATASWSGFAAGWFRSAANGFWFAAITFLSVASNSGVVGAHHSNSNNRKETCDATQYDAIHSFLPVIIQSGKLTGT